MTRAILWTLAGLGAALGLWIALLELVRALGLRRPGQPIEHHDTDELRAFRRRLALQRAAERQRSTDGDAA